MSVLGCDGAEVEQHEPAVSARALACDAMVLARWNDPAVWTGNPATGPVWFAPNGAGPNAGLPPSGAVVRIGATIQLRLDGTPRDAGGMQASLGGITIEGGLYADCQDLVLRVDWIDVNEGATFQIGTDEYPYTGTAQIILTDSYATHACSRNTVAACPAPGADPTAWGSGEPMMIRARGATVDLHGIALDRAWHTLAAPVAAGTADLLLAAPVPWPDGATVAIASTDFEPGQAETCTIDNRGGGLLRCAAPLVAGHWGGVVGTTATVDESAEVMLLDRNLEISVDGNVADPAGQLRFDPAATAPHVRLGWIEVVGLGHTGTLGLYPIHFHMTGDVMGSYVKHVSVRNSLHRAITVHMTDRLALVGNVAYGTTGHAIYLEMGTEHDNLIADNVVAGVWPIAGDPNDVSDDTPAAFYLSNPDNWIVGNRAAGSNAYGFYFICLEAIADPMAARCDWAPLTAFTGNVAHSNRYNGLDLDLMPKPDGEVHMHWTCVGDGAGGCLPARFVDFTAWKNGYYAAWIRTHGVDTAQRVETRLEGWRVADNRTGFYLASGGWQSPDDSRTIVTDAVVIGESENVGNPDTGFESTIAGRSLPNVRDCGVVPSPCPLGAPTAWSDPYQPIVGVDVYDGHLRVEDTAFAGFRTESWSATDRPAGAFSQTSPNQFQLNNDDNPWAVDPRNEVEDVTFDDANSVYMRPPLYWGESGAVTPVLRLLDGAGTGTVLRWATPQTALLDPGAAERIDAGPGSNAWLVDPEHAYAQVQVQIHPGSAAHELVDYLRLTARHNGATQHIRNPFQDQDRFGFQALVGPAYVYDIDYLHGPQCPLSTPIASCPFTPIAPTDVSSLALWLRFGRPNERLTLALPYTGQPQRVTFPVGFGSCTYEPATSRLLITLRLPPGGLFHPLQAEAVVAPGAIAAPGYCGP